MRRIEAKRKNAKAFRLRHSQSWAKRRQRLSHAIVRSTIHRLPAVSGLDEAPFTLEMHDDRDCHERYKQSTLSLTELGKATLAGVTISAGMTRFIAGGAAPN
jgi:hypothetical protein